MKPFSAKKLPILVLMIILGMLSSPLGVIPARAAGILYVMPGGTGDCSSWASACDLQTALAAAVSGDEIWVVAGTYLPHVSDRAVSFELKNGVAIYGGFDGTETSRDQRNPVANLTVLSGDLNGDDDSNVSIYETTRAENSYHVVTGATGATLDSLVIAGGNANAFASPNDRGSGIYNNSSSPILTNVTIFSNSANYFGGGMYNSSSNPTLTNVTFSNNTASNNGGGGGMYNNNSSPTLSSVTFSNNSAKDGGGMYNFGGSSPALTNVTFSSNYSTSNGGGVYNENSSPMLTETTFDGNSAYSNGGGMYNKNSSPTLTDVIFNDNMAGAGGGMTNVNNSQPILANVTFSNNTADSGGGMFNFSSSPMLTNATFSGNHALWWGGGMLNSSNSNPILTNVSFRGNSATEYGGGMYNFSSNPQIHNTIFWGNTAPYGGAQIYNDSSAPSVSDSVVQGGYTGGVNIVTTDPKLGTLGSYGGFTQVIPLLVDSSAIDAGNNATCATTDQRGIVRPQGVHCDIGAYEYVTMVVPDTKIDSKPADLNNSVIATFTFSSADATASFECSLDGSAFAACASPKNYTGLAAGSHTFAVRAKDPVGNTDGTPASFTWTIDLTAPDTQINSKPAGPSNSAAATFTFSSPDATASFECSLDGSVFAACASPKNYTGLAVGSHTFAVRATDPAGNTDGTPASFTWTIDLTAPDTQIHSKPADPSNSAAATFTFSSADATASFECSLDSSAFAACANPKNYTGLAAGLHTFAVRAKDPAGNTDATPASFTWTIHATVGIRYVKPAVSGSEDCSSWANACTLQTALTGAFSGNEIWVAAGTYLPHASENCISFELQNGVALYGGFAGTETERDQRDYEINKTILSGDLNGNDNDNIKYYEETRWENSFHVVSSSGVDGTAVLDGFTISGGNAGEDILPNPCTNHLSGGGIYNQNSHPTLANLIIEKNAAFNEGGGIFNDQSSPTLTNVIIQNNAVESYGAGIFNRNNSNPSLSDVTIRDNISDWLGGGIINLENSNPSLSNVVFVANSAVEGGGMFNDSSNPILANVVFRENSTSLGGAGIYNFNSNPLLTNVTFEQNFTDGYGGGMMNHESNPVLLNVTFSANVANAPSGGSGVNGEGGGMHNYVSNPLLINVTMTGNDGGGLYNMDSLSLPTLKNVIIANSLNGVDCGSNEGEGIGSLNPASSHNLIGDPDNACGLENGVNGNIVGVDPRLDSLADNGGFTQTHALLAGSPASDAGTCLDAPTTDQRGIARPQGARCDIGAYEAAITFADVPASHWAWDWIERLYSAGITGGCSASPLSYCPEQSVTRAQMAIFLLRGIHGSDYAPPSVGGSTGFSDVPVSYWASAWIKQFYAEGITGGCGSGVYCPDQSVTRAQMAIFLLRARHGSNYAPPAVGQTTGFGDVPPSHWASAWIKQLAIEGITGGCGNGNYCPEEPVTRAQMAVFLVRAFGLP